MQIFLGRESVTRQTERQAAWRKKAKSVGAPAHGAPSLCDRQNTGRRVLECPIGGSALSKVRRKLKKAAALNIACFKGESSPQCLGTSDRFRVGRATKSASIIRCGCAEVFPGGLLRRCRSHPQTDHPET